MKKILTLLFILSALLFSCKQVEQKHVDKAKIDYLRKGFKVPPLEARPRALWDWVDGNFSLDEITHEMEEAKAKGMGGFDIWDVRKVMDEDNIVPVGPAFMSDAYLKGIVHAINEAERLDLDLGLIVASGWNAGGPWTKPEHQTMGLFRSEKLITGRGDIIRTQLDFPDLHDKVDFNGRSKKTIIPKGKDGLPIYYSEVKVLAFPMTKDSAVIKKGDVIDVSNKLDKKGNLKWLAPKGKWRIIRYVCTNTGQPMISSTPNSGGPMIDHFNPEATVDHINFFIDKLEEKLGKPIGESGLNYFYTDSYEVQGLLWTEKLLAIFEKEAGYSMTPFLPVFDGFIVEDKEITDRFLYDYRKVWSDLIINSHYKKAREICEEHGIGFVAEAAGPGMPVHNCPFESLKSSGALSFPRGEFWHVPKKNPYFAAMDTKQKNHFLNELQVIKGVSSASHLYDQKYVEAEAFTGIHIWVEGPGDLKADADRAFCEGLNRVIFHTWPHTPKIAGKPGWAYTFGTLMHETRIWWPMAKPWMDYLGRTSFMLQQGNFIGDLLFYYGDSVPNFAPPKKFNKELGYGYDYDVTNTDIILNKLDTHNGDLTLQNGQRYKVLVLPDKPYLTYDVLKKLSELVAGGATVIGRKPVRSHGLKNWQEHDKKVIELADQLWGDCNGTTVTEHQYKKGKIIWGKSLKQVLQEMNTIPDFDFKGNVENKKLDFIHRKTDAEDIYFIRNTTDKNIYGEAYFRVKDKQPEFWNPVSGKMNEVQIYSIDNDKTTIPISLQPEESFFVIFTSGSNKEHINKVIKDNQQIYPQMAERQPDFMQDKNSDQSQILFSTEGKYMIYNSKDKVKTLKIDFIPSVISLEEEWKVNFPKDKKGIGEIEFENLYSWHKSNIFDVKFFSGIATYKKDFYLSEEMDLKPFKIVLDLGVVRDVAHVYVNDQDAGISWVKPNKINISKYIKKGQNTLKIEVANTWHNRLCGDARLPVKERITKTNVTRLPTPWTFPMKDIPLHNGKEQYELQESGLLGPVTINFMRKYIVKQ